MMSRSRQLSYFARARTTTRYLLPPQELPKAAIFGVFTDVTRQDQKIAGYASAYGGLAAYVN
ncbi:hypothetical protein BLL42_17970 [Pseudomonas frederiksbergensis]|uniref:Uncharacterized protein n=1 Tax=Pseudomonas frederiksbergensis TaxID=104087 RepID=A0A1J0EN08_9PSED|nr:hypothetical protein BLL42_17970 [Pseudomonas frederiksbergensis]